MEIHREVMWGSSLFRKGWNMYVNRVQENFELSHHSHDFIEITYVCEGRGYHHVGDQVQAAAKGDLFILPVGVSHVFRPYSARKDQRLIVVNCVFTESLLQVISKEMAPELNLAAMFHIEAGTAPSVGYRLYDRELTLEPLFQSMITEYSAPQAGSPAYLFALLIQLLVSLQRKLAHVDSSAVRVPADPMAEALHYIRQHAAEDLTISHMAGFLRMSERHFFRLFKERTGQTFHDYLQHTRVRSACELLQCTVHKVSVVAELVGYRDSDSFHRVFKRIVGIPPGEYRRRQKAR